MDNGKRDVEAELSALLTEGEMDKKNPGAEAPRRLSPRHEVRVQTERDPIAEETAKYRKMAREIDGRYDKYAPRDSR